MSEEKSSESSGKNMVLSLPSGQEIFVSMTSLPLLDAQQQRVGTILQFYEITHWYEKILHLQRVWEAVSALAQAITHVPAHIGWSLSEDILLLSPPVLFIAQQLVDVLRQVLKCHHVELFALGSTMEYIYYVAGSGCTPEQEQYRLEQRGRFKLSEYLDETGIARFQANQEVILPADLLRSPTECRVDIGFQQPPGDSPVY